MPRSTRSAKRASLDSPGDVEGLVSVQTRKMQAKRVRLEVDLPPPPPSVADTDEEAENIKQQQQGEEEEELIEGGERPKVKVEPEQRTDAGAPVAADASIPSLHAAALAAAAILEASASCDDGEVEKTEELNETKLFNAAIEEETFPLSQEF